MVQVDVNPNAPAVASASTFVKAPAEAVWSVLVDFKSWPTWNKDVSKMELKGDVKVGSTFIWLTNGTKICSTLEYLERPKRIAWSGSTLGIRAIHVWEFVEKDGGTVVRTKESFDGFIVRIFRGLFRRMLSTALEQGVMALKSEAEARHSAAKA